MLYCIILQYNKLKKHTVTRKVIKLTHKKQTDDLIWLYFVNKFNKNRNIVYFCNLRFTSCPELFFTIFVGTPLHNQLRI